MPCVISWHRRITWFSVIVPCPHWLVIIVWVIIPRHPRPFTWAANPFSSARPCSCTSVSFSMLSSHLGAMADWGWPLALSVYTLQAAPHSAGTLWGLLEPFAFQSHIQKSSTFLYDPRSLSLHRIVQGLEEERGGTGNSPTVHSSSSPVYLSPLISPLLYNKFRPGI